VDKIIPVRMDSSLVQELDAIIQRGIFKNRNEGIREGIRTVIAEYKSATSQYKSYAQIAANYILNLYQSEIIAIILYGSVARGTETEDSDIDLMVITRNVFPYAKKTSLIEALVKLFSEMPFLISLHFESITEFKKAIKENYQFEHNILSEGIILGGEKFEALLSSK
jgi:predicted nucleotidyltransferase